MLCCVTGGHKHTRALAPIFLFRIFFFFFLLCAWANICYSSATILTTLPQCNPETINGVFFAPVKTQVLPLCILKAASYPPPAPGTTVTAKPVFCGSA